MLRLARLTDYGIVLMSHIAAQPADAVHNARDIARDAGIPLPTTNKLLKLLAKEGLLTSRRGAKGGYSLTHEPARISVGDVIQALEGPIALTACSSGHHPGETCAIESLCPTRTNWRRINHAVATALQSISIAEMAQPTSHPNPFAFFNGTFSRAAAPPIVAAPAPGMLTPGT